MREPAAVERAAEIPMTGGPTVPPDAREGVRALARLLARVAVDEELARRSTLGPAPRTP